MFGFSIVKTPFGFTDVKTITIPTISSVNNSGLLNKFNMFITAVCVLFLIKLRWPKNKSIYEVDNCRS